MKRALVIVIVLAAAGLLGFMVYKRIMTSGKRSGRRRAAAVAVEIVPIRKTTIRNIAQFYGTLLPKTQFVVAPKISGRLEKLHVNIGDPVKKDDLIAELDDEEYAQQVAQARAELEVAKANVAECRSALDVAKREFERARALRQKKIASESELDEADAQYKARQAKQEVALAQVKQREAALETAKVRASYTRIQASWQGGDNPESGRFVGERFVDEGAMLKANDPIVSILDIRSLLAVIHVIERDYPRVGIDQKAVFTTDAFPGRTFVGRIIRVAPVLKETSRQARVEVEVLNPDLVLKPGMFVRVQIEFSRHADTTVVPVGALTMHNDQQGVFLADMTARKARFVPVTLGIQEGDRVEVVSPPVTGMVITLGKHLLENGTDILLPEGNPPAASRPTTQRDTAAARRRAPAGAKP